MRSVTGRKLFDETRVLSVCIIQMVVPMFDASMVNAYGPCVQRIEAGERWCGLHSLPTTFLAKKVLNGTLNSRK